MPGANKANSPCIVVVALCVRKVAVCSYRVNVVLYLKLWDRCLTIGIYMWTSLLLAYLHQVIL